MATGSSARKAAHDLKGGHLKVILGIPSLVESGPALDSALAPRLANFATVDLLKRL
jgi:hypothetical protein